MSDELSSTGIKLLSSPKKKRQKHATITSTEKMMIMNIYKLIEEMWPKNEYIYRKEIARKTAKTAGVSLSKVYVILKTFKVERRVTSPVPPPKKYATLTTSTEKMTVINIYKLIEEMWPKNEHMYRKEIARKTAQTAGVSLSKVYEILKTFKRKRRVTSPVPPPKQKTTNCDSPPVSSLDYQTEEDDIDMPDAFSDYTMTSCDLEACRVCLAPRQLRRMTVRARRAYGLLTGLPTTSDGHLPPYVCAECGHRLRNFIRFRTASLRAHLILLETIKKHKKVTMESIKSVAGEQRIGSSLSVTHNRPDHYDLEIEHEEDNDMVTDDDECMPRRAILNLPTVPDDGDCDVKSEPDEMDSEGSLDYEYRPDDTNDDIEISEVKIEIEPDVIRATDDDVDCGDSDNEIVKRFKSNDNVNNIDKHRKKAPVPHESITKAVKNNPVNKKKCKDKVVTNDPKVCVVSVPRLPEVKSVSKDNDDAVPGNVIPVGR